MSEDQADDELGLLRRRIAQVDTDMERRKRRNRMIAWVLGVVTLIALVAVPIVITRHNAQVEHDRLACRYYQAFRGHTFDEAVRICG